MWQTVCSKEVPSRIVERILERAPYIPTHQLPNPSNTEVCRPGSQRSKLNLVLTFLNVIEGGEKGAMAKCGRPQYQLRGGLYQSGRDLGLETMDAGGKHGPGPPGR